MVRETGGEEGWGEKEEKEGPHTNTPTYIIIQAYTAMQTFTTLQTIFARYYCIVYNRIVQYRLV